MSLYAVVRKAGPGWSEGKGAMEQPGVGDHTAFMGGLADEHFVLCAGPLAGTETSRIRALVILDAADGEEIRERLRDDPWAHSERLVTTTIEPWTLFVGADRLLRGRSVPT